MAKKFISLLGITDYKECVYYLDDKKAKPTNFIQEALIELLCEDWNEEDKAIVLLTEKAKNDNWYNPYNEKRRLKDNLLNRFNIQVESRCIPEGKNIDEIWIIFDIIVNILEDGDEVIFDITNSFRSIPMLALTVINYAKVVKNIKLSGIYYGAFEIGDYNNGDTEFQIIDLTSLDEILEWTNAINSFVRYGNGEHIKSISNGLLDKQRIMNGRNSQQDEIRRFVGSLNNFTGCINTCRGRLSENKTTKSGNKNSIYKSYVTLDSNLSEIINNNNDSIRPLKPLFTLVRENIKDFKEKSNKSINLSTGIAVVDWCVNNGLIQQGYTALEETMNTYICYMFNLNENSKVDRDDIVNDAINIRCYNIKEENWKKINVDTIEEYTHIKTSRHFIVNNLDEDIKKLADKIKKNRNDINHFGFTDRCSKDFLNLETDLKDFRNQFLELVKSKNKELYDEIEVVI